MQPAGPAVLLLASLLPLSAVDGADVAARAACPHRRYVRTFGNGLDQFNMTVAADLLPSERSLCRGELQCTPLFKPVAFCQDGWLMEVEVRLAWVCAAERSGVPAAPVASLFRARRSAVAGSGPRRGVTGLRRCRGRTDSQKQREQKPDDEEKTTRRPVRLRLLERLRRLRERNRKLKRQLELQEEACQRKLKKELKLQRQKEKARRSKLKERLKRLRQGKRKNNFKSGEMIFQAPSVVDE